MDELRKKRARKLEKNAHWFRQAQFDVQKLKRALRRHERSSSDQIKLSSRFQSLSRQMNNRLSPETQKEIEEKLEELDQTDQLVIRINGSEKRLNVSDFKALEEYLAMVYQANDGKQIEIIDKAIEHAVDEKRIEKAVDMDITEDLDDLFTKAKEDEYLLFLIFQYCEKAAVNGSYQYIEDVLEHFGSTKLNAYKPWLTRSMISHVECEDKEDQNKRESLRQTVLGILERIDPNWYRTTDGLVDLNTLCYLSDDFHTLLLEKPEWAEYLVHLKIYEQEDVLRLVQKDFPQVYFERADNG